MAIKSDLSLLKTKDIYSLILFALFKLKDIPEYSTLSELAYLLDKESLFNMCEYFGGMTIKIPTISDLEVVVYALIMYTKIDIEGRQEEAVVAEMNLAEKDFAEVYGTYKRLVNVLKDYSFSGRELE